MLRKSTNLEKTLRDSAKRKENLTPEEHEYENFKELKRHLMSARAVENSLSGPEEGQDPRLKKAARYNITRIGALASEMIDSDAGGHPIRDAMERKGIDANIVNDLAETRRDAREMPDDATATQWKGQYENAEEVLETLNQMVEDPEVEETLKRKAEKSKAKRMISDTWANTDRSLGENTQNAISEAFDGKGHDDDMLAALKLFEIGYGIASPVVSSTLGSVKSGLTCALLPAIRSSKRLTSQWQIGKGVKAERLPEEVTKDRSEKDAFEIEEALVGREKAQTGRHAEEVTPEAGENPAVQRKRNRDETRYAAAKLETTINQMPKSLRTRITREIVHRGGQTPEWNKLAGTTHTRRRSYQFVAGKKKTHNQGEASTLAHTLEHRTPMPKEHAEFIAVVREMFGHDTTIDEEKGTQEEGQTSNTQMTDREKVEQASGALIHMGYIEVAHEQLAQAGKNALQLLRNPLSAEYIGGMDKGTQLLLQQTKEFAILAISNEHGVHPDELPCEEVAMRTESIWERLDPKTRASMSKMTVSEMDGRPQAEHRHMPRMNNIDEARWAAQAGEKLVKEVRGVRTEIESSTKTIDPKLFASRTGQTKDTKKGTERE